MFPFSNDGPFFALNSIDTDSIAVLNLSGDHSTDAVTVFGGGDRWSDRYFIHPSGEIHLSPIIVVQHQSCSFTVWNQNTFTIGDSSCPRRSRVITNYLKMLLEKGKYTFQCSILSANDEAAIEK